MKRITFTALGVLSALMVIIYGSMMIVDNVFPNNPTVRLDAKMEDGKNARIFVQTGEHQFSWLPNAFFGNKEVLIQPEPISYSQLNDYIQTGKTNYVILSDQSTKWTYRKVKPHFGIGGFTGWKEHKS